MAADLRARTPKREAARDEAESALPVILDPTATDAEKDRATFRACGLSEEETEARMAELAESMEAIRATRDPEEGWMSGTPTSGEKVMLPPIAVTGEEKPQAEHIRAIGADYCTACKSTTCTPEALAYDAAKRAQWEAERLAEAGEAKRTDPAPPSHGAQLEAERLAAEFAELVKTAEPT